MNPVVELVNVTKSYPSNEGVAGAPILSQVDFRVEKGESVSIVGPSGCGKSTLLNLIGGLDRPDQGDVFIDGENLRDLDPDQLALVRQRKIGFIFQFHHLLPQCSALENVLLPTLADTKSEERAACLKRARDLMDRVGLSHRLDHRPSSLSGGESQRVAVVRALVRDPLVVLADEPTGSLDPVSARSLGDLLVELQREREKTLIVVTHSEDLALRFSRVVELEERRLRPPEKTSIEHGAS